MQILISGICRFVGSNLVLRIREHWENVIVLGFEGCGYQVRDFFHPQDLIPLLKKQMATRSATGRTFNVGGGRTNSISLAQLCDWCANRFGPREVAADSKPRPFDIPGMVLDSRHASEKWAWRVETPIDNILEEIAAHAEGHPDWLELSAQ